jgi:S1-C subfamily serine protease
MSASEGDDDLMLRAVVFAMLFATLFFVGSSAASGQAVSVLHVKVVVVDAEGKATPVPRHALLISDNPPTSSPERIVTALDGTAEVTLRPGNYTVESDRPVVFRGKVYQWTQMVDIVAGRGAVLELTADNADVGPPASATASAAPPETDPSFLVPQWQDSVVALWTPSTHASGFLIDARGLIATNQRVIGTATSVEVQLSPDVKVAASVLSADPVRDVAVLWIDPRVAASLRSVPLGCGQSARPPVVEGQELFTIDAPLRVQKGMSSGTVSRVEPHAIVSDFRLASGSAGGPVFTAGGVVVGITSIGADQNESRNAAARVVRIDDACDVVASAEKKMKEVAPPDGTHLPVEPARPFSVDALKDAAQRRGGSLSPYQMSSSDFDIAFITPVLIYGAQHKADQLHQADRERDRERRGGARTPDPAPVVVSPLMEFGNWSDYAADFPPVLLIRVTPKLVEGFWTTVGRGAARTQGVSLPANKHSKAGFSRMRVFCGDAEVTPIHPFKLEQRVSESDAIHEGLYVLDPGALGPQCGAVKLVLFSEKEPAKGDTRPVDPRVIEQIWQDFAPYRER